MNWILRMVLCLPKGDREDSIEFWAIRSACDAFAELIVNAVDATWIDNVVPINDRFPCWMGALTQVNDRISPESLKYDTAWEDLQPGLERAAAALTMLALAASHGWTDETHPTCTAGFRSAIRHLCGLQVTP